MICPSLLVTYPFTISYWLPAQALDNHVKKCKLGPFRLILTIVITISIALTIGI